MHTMHLLDLLSTAEESRPNKPVPTKSFWTYIKSKRSHDIGVASLNDNDVDAKDNFGKVNLLSTQFKSVFTKEKLDNIPSLGPSPYPDVPNYCVYYASNS